jgi:hypothetical protein
MTKPAKNPSLNNKQDQNYIATDYDISMKYHMIESTALTKALDKLAPKKEAAT